MCVLGPEPKSLPTILKLPFLCILCSIWVFELFLLLLFLLSIVWYLLFWIFYNSHSNCSETITLEVLTCISLVIFENDPFFICVACFWLFANLGENIWLLLYPISWNWSVIFWHLYFLFLVHSACQSLVRCTIYKYFLPFWVLFLKWAIDDFICYKGTS